MTSRRGIVRQETITEPGAVGGEGARMKRNIVAVMLAAVMLGLLAHPVAEAAIDQCGKFPDTWGSRWDGRYTANQDAPAYGGTYAQMVVQYPGGCTSHKDREANFVLDYVMAQGQDTLDYAQAGYYKSYDTPVYHIAEYNRT